MEDFKLILDGLYRICYKNEKSTDIINNIAREVSDISYITKNIYGVLENKLYLEYIIGKLSKIKIKKLDKKVLLILEIGIYNIHFLDRKNYAIVNELVNLTKKVSYKSKSFVNAILRSYIRDEENLSKIKAKNKEQFQSIKYSIPLWIINYLNESYGYDYTEKFLNSLNKERKLSIRVNKNKIEKNKLKTLLEEKGYEVEESKISSSFGIIFSKVPSTIGFSSLPIFISPKNDSDPPALHRVKYSSNALSLFSSDFIKNWNAQTCARV